MKVSIHYVPAIIEIKVIEAPTPAQAPMLWKEIDSMMRRSHCRRVLVDVRGVQPTVNPQQVRERAVNIRQESGLLKHARLAMVYDQYRKVAEAFAEKLAVGGFDVKVFTSVPRATDWLCEAGDQFADRGESVLIPK